MKKEIKKIIGIIVISIFIMSCGTTKVSEEKQFLSTLTSQSRYLTPDQIAKRVIEGDPSLRLIDVRNSFDFEKYSLPGSENFPLNEILKEENLSKLNIDHQELVLFSNSDIYSDQAWVLLTQKGYKNLYVLKGGLNEWFKTIMLPEKPLEGSSSEELDLYSFRKGASLYFGGSLQEIPKAVAKGEVEKAKTPAIVPKKKVEVEQKVKKVSEGGC